MARDYILYEWRPPGRPLPPSRRPTFPPPRMKQGPYWVENTEEGVIRCTLRRGTWQYRRMQAEQKKAKRKQEELHDVSVTIALPILALVVLVGLVHLLRDLL